jgi:DNA-binding MarR family transcriptional regulator
MKLTLTKNETEAWVSLVLSAEKLLDKVDSELKKKGLPPYSWYDVLLELDKCKDGKLRFVELGNRVLLPRYNVTRTVNRLEKAGLANRIPSEDDARGYYAVITRKGRTIRKKMWPVYYNVLKDYLFSSLSAKELEDFLNHLRKIRKSIESRNNLS